MRHHQLERRIVSFQNLSLLVCLPLKNKYLINEIATSPSSTKSNRHKSPMTHIIGPPAMAFIMFCTIIFLIH